MENLESKKHLLYAVRIIFERQEIENIWESHKWVINDLIPLNVSSGEGYPPINDVRIYPLLGWCEGCRTPPSFSKYGKSSTHRKLAASVASPLKISLRSTSMYLDISNKSPD